MYLPKTKEFVQPLMKGLGAFLSKYEVRGDTVDAGGPNCMCGKPMITSGKCYICEKKCKFQVSKLAYELMIEKEYVNEKVALTSGIIVPKCLTCLGCKIVTGGETWAPSTLFFRCYCQKNNLKCVLAKHTSHEATVERMCNVTGFWNYSELPNEQSINGAASNDGGACNYAMDI